MEMFSAGDESQWKLIARTIEESDYYVVIVANRYGSTEPGTEISYTEKEYLHAESLRVPTLGFVIDSKASWPLDRQEADQKKREALGKFKDRVHRKICSKWDSGIDLAGKVSIALSKQFVLNPRPGWVRASDAVTPQIANELSRLREENSQFRRRVEESTRGSIRRSPIGSPTSTTVSMLSKPPQSMRKPFTVSRRGRVPQMQKQARELCRSSSMTLSKLRKRWGDWSLKTTLSPPRRWRSLAT
jgi:hypothetical protein